MRVMTKRKKNQNKSGWLLWLGLACLAILAAALGYFMRGREIPLLNPKGVIADEQYKLLIVSTTIMLIFAAIIIFFIYFFAWKYREHSNKVVFDSHAGRSKPLVFTAWASPIFIFIVLAAMMLPATQRLEPQKSIESDKDEIVIRVIAMRWKWVFLYPQHDIATVNYVHIPVDTPVRFDLTADEAPMQSFWIPHLGGMLYAMTEHVNPLNLMAHTTGEYNGGAAEINGNGFSGMRFIAKVSEEDEFKSWVNETVNNALELEKLEYERLLQPDETEFEKSYYSPTNVVLFDDLIAKYYTGSHSHGSSHEPSYSGGHH